MSRRPILIVKDAGFGETPVPANALFQPGELIGVARESAPDVSVTVTCLAVVPAGSILEYAMADQAQPPYPRPLMLAYRRPYRETVYVLQFEDETEPRIYTQTEMVTGCDKAATAFPKTEITPA